MSLVFVDCEAVGPCPSAGALTEFGAVAYVRRNDPRRHLFVVRENVVDSGPVPMPPTVKP